MHRHVAETSADRTSHGASPGSRGSKTQASSGSRGKSSTSQRRPRSSTRTWSPGLRQAARGDRAAESGLPITIASTVCHGPLGHSPLRPGRPAAPVDVPAACRGRARRSAPAPRHVAPSVGALDAERRELLHEVEEADADDAGGHAGPRRLAVRHDVPAIQRRVQRRRVVPDLGLAASSAMSLIADHRSAACHPRA